MDLDQRRRMRIFYAPATCGDFDLPHQFRNDPTGPWCTEYKIAWHIFSNDHKEYWGGSGQTLCQTCTTQERIHKNRDYMPWSQLLLFFLFKYCALFLFFWAIWVGYLKLMKGVWAHGTLEVAGEVAARQEYSLANAMNLAHCTAHLQKRGILEQATQRRIDKYNQYSQLVLRNVGAVLGTNHEITDGSINWDSTDAEIFATRDDGCVLSAESTEGPFYVEGEHVRWALWDNESGIPMYLDLQIIDTETCEPVPDIWVEVWHANATGIYSGVISGYNGAGEDDPDNAFTTFHRGIQKTNAEGAVWFGTNFPGFYSNRTPHVHIMTHAEGTEALANDTVQNNVATHAGQMFFDQGLVDMMREHERYNFNTQLFIENKDDAYFRQEAEFTDPVMSYVLLDHEKRNIEEGILAWKLVGVNMTNVRELRVANHLQG
ncbi:extracellular dioxygenase [Colletotrichum karsti]|uniref:Extracellular dioxygenase n=1 Tax=Colletotrichum karsti TaxID=1095194 RepID=A0A9P6LL56_9PEZI|nr:extracellular dioxygenase [Colletotrichum karsti]KAF9876886.1 extracellular dioxygenase [Colletotrichum karsti]